MTAAGDPRAHINPLSVGEAEAAMREYFAARRARGAKCNEPAQGAEEIRLREACVDKLLVLIHLEHNARLGVKHLIALCEFGISDGVDSWVHVHSDLLGLVEAVEARRKPS